MGSLLSGAVAGVSFWCFNYPVDYVKTIMQADSLTSPQYKGMLHCFRHEAPKGLPVFFTGLGIMIARAMVSNGFGFACFEMAKKAVY